MVLLDGTITIVALLSIGADLGFSKQDLLWVLSACAVLAGIGLALALLLPGRPRVGSAVLSHVPRGRGQAAEGDVVTRSGAK